MTVTIGRRELLAAFGGAAAAWPLVARAQQAATPVVGFFHSGSPEPNVAFVAAFRKGLNEAGFVEGQNVTIEFRWAAGQVDRVPELAADLVRRRVAVIATPGSTPAALAAKAATATIPIVFATGGDPVAIGLAKSLNRPGGNATGISFETVELIGKGLELLRELTPQPERFAALVDPKYEYADAIVTNLRAGAASLGVPIEILHAGMVCGSWRPHELRNEPDRNIPSSRHLHRQNPQGCKAGRPAGRAVEQVRADHQSAHRPRAWP